HALAHQLAVATHGLGLLARPPLRRLLVVAAQLHLAEDTLALHLLLQDTQRLIDIVVANENLHGPFNLLSTDDTVPCRTFVRCTGTPFRKGAFLAQAPALGKGRNPLLGQDLALFPLVAWPGPGHIPAMAILKIARMGHPVLRR